MLNVLLREQRQVETSIENVMADIERGVITNTTTESRGCFVYKGRKENFDIEIWIV